MANPTQFPGDIVVPGTLRLTGALSPAKARSDILELAELQTFTVPMSVWRDDTDGARSSMSPGKGIFLGSGTICEHHVFRHGGLIKTEILVDVTGLNDGGTAGDVIGKDGGTADCHIGKITAAVNGTIIAGRIHCLEVPAGGNVDIDLWGSVDEATLAQDTAITAATGEEQLINHGNWAANEIDELTALPDADGYLYLANGASTDADYTGGIFLIEMWGTPANNSLVLVGGTHGTNALSLQTPDVGGNGAAATYIRRGEIMMPAEYVAGQSVEIRLHAGMLTTVADQACTVDIAVYKSDEDETSTGDICADAASTDNMNSLVFADIDFTITATTLSPGDLLDVQITVSVDDNGDAGVIKGCIGSVQLLCDVR